MSVKKSRLWVLGLLLLLLVFCDNFSQLNASSTSQLTNQIEVLEKQLQANGIIYDRVWFDEYESTGDWSYGAFYYVRNTDTLAHGQRYILYSNTNTAYGYLSFQDEYDRAITLSPFTHRSRTAEALAEPMLQLPWSTGKLGSFNSGPHNPLGMINNIPVMAHPWSGIDLGLPEESINDAKFAVHAANSGQLIQLEFDANNRLCGMTIQDGDAWGVRYIHMTPLSVLQNRVAEGDFPINISAGQIIGYLQESNICGAATGIHLHLDLIQDDDEKDFSGYFIGGWEMFHI